MRRGCFRILARSAEGRGRTSGRLRRPSLYPPSLGLLAGHTCPRAARMDRASARLRTRVLSPPAVCSCPFDLCRGACGHRAGRRPQMRKTAPWAPTGSGERTRSRLQPAAAAVFTGMRGPISPPCLPVSPRISPPSSQSSGAGFRRLGVRRGEAELGQSVAREREHQRGLCGDTPWSCHGQHRPGPAARCAEMCRDVPRCAEMCRGVPRCAEVCRDVPVGELDVPGACERTSAFSGPLPLLSSPA